MRTVAVFGSGKISEKDPEYQQAFELGKLLAQNGYTILNGGYGGVMEASAKGACEVKGKCISITVGSWKNKTNQWASERRVAEHWKERLFQLVNTADAYVVLDGGTGTLTEFFILWEMMDKKEMLRKPAIILGNFIESLLEFLQKQNAKLFAHQFNIAKNPHEVIQFLKTTGARHQVPGT